MLGALYLGYDFLGGEHGPLRTLTSGVTCGVLFGVGYGLGFKAIFGLVTGAGDQIRREPQTLDDVKNYVTNLVRWLAPLS